jgi:hypothetical protein
MHASLRRRRICWCALPGLLACGFGPEPAGNDAAPPAAVARPADAGQRRAVLVGIDDYSASRLPQRAAAGARQERAVPDLEGAVNDVRAVREMLIAAYGFAADQVVLLSDQAATREAILRVLDEQLWRPARPGDVLLFYFSGHGSQVANSLSDEPDHLDESIVPADTRRGAPDIRDKELRRAFNRILDRGARLTVVLDSCHSGSGARPADLRFRGVEPDRRDVRDGSPAGPRPEDREALVLSATQDFDLAWETRDEEGRPHGAFSAALLRAMRDAAPGESAEETFLRSRARLQAEKRFQEPVLAGSATMRRAPLLGRPARAGLGGRVVVAVERVEKDGTVVLQGGWANGLAPGTELTLLDAGPGPAARLRVTAMRGLARCEARMVAAEQAAPAAVRSGALAEVVAWAAQPGAPLRVWISQVPGTVDGAARLAEELAREAPRRGVRWVEDPTASTPTHVLRWRGEGWELAETRGGVERLGLQDASTGAVLARVEKAQCPALYVQVPAPAALARSIAVGSGTAHDGVEPTADPGQADYLLAGRLAGGRLEYAWLRPGIGPRDRRRSGLPPRTSWHPLDRTGAADAARTGAALEEAVLLLRKIHAWHHLDSPAGAGFEYGLVLRGESGAQPAAVDVLTGGERYVLALRAKAAVLPGAIAPRYVYVFVIDSYGKSTLLFPASSVENRFPVPPGPGQPPAPAPREIPLGPRSAFEVTAPYGMDTFFLLTSDEPLPNPWVLDWSGVRIRGPRGGTPLEELLSVTGGAARSASRIVTPAAWSIEKLLIETRPPRTAAAPKGQP